MCEIATKFVRFMDVCFAKLFFLVLCDNGAIVPQKWPPQYATKILQLKALYILLICDTMCMVCCFCYIVS